MTTRISTEDDRAERRRRDRDRLEQAARTLLSSEGWQRWVRVRSANGLSRYSFHNQLLIAMQRPDATFVAGFRAFLALNRCVRKGERAIRILAPIRPRAEKKGAEVTTVTPDDADTPRIIFRAVSVFDVSQTDALPDTEPVPLSPPSEPIDGDSHAHLVEPLVELAGELGFTVCFKSLEGSAEGWCDNDAHRIVVSDRLPVNARVRVLIHEIAHAQGIGYTDFGRRRAEVLVDTVTFVVCGSMGLDVSGSSVPYVAGWGEDGDLDAIRTYAETIDTVARRIEDSIAPSASAQMPDRRRDTA